MPRENDKREDRDEGKEGRGKRGGHLDLAVTGDESGGASGHTRPVVVDDDGGPRKGKRVHRNHVARRSQLPRQTTVVRGADLLTHTSRKN